MKKIILSFLILLSSPLLLGQEVTLESLYQLIKQQQTEINELKGKIEQQESKIQETRIITESTADAVEDQLINSSEPNSWVSNFSLGGYGEVLYNNGTQRSDNADPSTPNREIDVQRFVLFTGYKFSDTIRLFSELEVEHSNTAGAGAVELEQAFIQWDYTKNHSVLAGLYLPPLGIINETHEPNTFYGVERNRIESRIIPTTYRTIGVNFHGQVAPGWSYDLGIHEGLQLADNLTIRSSRQSGSRSNAQALAGTARVKYTGYPGLEWGLSFQYQSDLTQSGIGNSRLGRSVFTGDSISALLSETHVAYTSNRFGFRALYARWDIDNAIEQLGGIGRDQQVGWYIEPSYKLTDKLGVFIRQEFVDEIAGDNVDSAENRTLFGVNYWLTEKVVLKADFQLENDDNRTADLDGFNLGLGWSF